MERDLGTGGFRRSGRVFETRRASLVRVPRAAGPPVSATAYASTGGQAARGTPRVRSLTLPSGLVAKPPRPDLREPSLGDLVGQVREFLRVEGADAPVEHDELRRAVGGADPLRVGRSEPRVAGVERVAPRPDVRRHLAGQDGVRAALREAPERPRGVTQDDMDVPGVVA